MSVCVRVRARICTRVHMHVHAQWHRSEVTLQELVVSFQHVGPGDHTQIIKLSGRHIYPVSHPVSPQNCDFSFV